MSSPTDYPPRSTQDFRSVEPSSEHVPRPGYPAFGQLETSVKQLEDVGADFTSDQMFGRWTNEPTSSGLADVQSRVQ